MSNAITRSKLARLASPALIELVAGATEAERQAAEFVFGRGHSVRWTARHLRLTRARCRRYLDRTKSAARAA